MNQKVKPMKTVFFLKFRSIASSGERRFSEKLICPQNKQICRVALAGNEMLSSFVALFYDSE